MNGSFFGVTPYLSGNDANPKDAPWNQTTRECPHCKGYGVMYADSNVIYDHEEYIALSEEDKLFIDEITCPECDGNGEIGY